MTTMIAFSKKIRFGVVSVVSFLAVLSFVVRFSTGVANSEAGLNRLISNDQNSSESYYSSSNRKLLSRSLSMKQPNRIFGDSCTNADIEINQGPTASLPNGVPSYTVEISNVCFTGCQISAIHIKCGWFSSARLINPKIFRRLRYNDCLVNDGKPLIYGGTVSFEYSNTYSYPLSVSAVIC
ncbi:TPD1 protein homolog 1-like [Mercurialis annua]|uniref:TPD1 protein homolog 1-like n=1 Tax=Mercurialis annua TaxID=3986 RepID=UPI00215FC2A3|nr:TPD1 protein homolog 1-like [Mercurialis annua]XP_050224627.1 TPD1 protein homolog 1-like [Mercurialis annua]